MAGRRMEPAHVLWSTNQPSPLLGLANTKYWLKHFFWLDMVGWVCWEVYLSEYI